jgi:arylsulfatase A-like enzyme
MGCFGLPLLSLLACFQLHAAAQERPNVVLILADDLGWMDVASYAARARGVERSECYYETPHLDRLAD